MTLGRAFKADGQQTAVDNPISSLSGCLGLIRSDRSLTTVRVSKHAIRQVVVLEVVGRPGDFAQELDWAIQLALASGPRGVICDLKAAVAGVDPDAIELIAQVGRHVRDWPGIPVAMACPDLLVREALRAHPLGEHLIVTDSRSRAVFVVLATPNPSVASRQLAPHPRAPRASRDFVTHTLLDWRLGRVIPFATLVVSQLVASSSIDAGTEIDVSIAWDRDALRLTVLDHGPAIPGQRPSVLNLHRRALIVVAGLSRAFGVLPTADDGKLVWAVLDAARPRSSAGRVRSEPATALQGSPVFIEGAGVAELPFCAGSSRQLA